MQPDESVNAPLPRRPFWCGVVACILFAIVAVLLRGIRWDETYEHAQIIAGHVTYPPGHPLAVYVHNAFSLQTYLSAALLKLGAGPAFLCGLRNILFLLASILPLYALVALMTRSTLAGLFSTLLLLQGILLEFDGSYPTMVWPEIYSNGHIGGGVVLLALVALLAGAHRSAFFLLGLIPCIHLGQWPPLVGTMGVYVAYLLYVHGQERKAPLITSIGIHNTGNDGRPKDWRVPRVGPVGVTRVRCAASESASPPSPIGTTRVSPERPTRGTRRLFHEGQNNTGREYLQSTELPKLLPLIGMTALGLACTLLFYGIQQQFTVVMPTAGPFAVPGDATAVWQGYTALHDLHRKFPPGNGHVVLVGAILLCMLGAFFGREATLRKTCAWLGVYCGGIGAAVWLTMALHAWFGAEMPFLLIAWMPYRLINHIPLILLAVMTTLIILRWPVRGWWMVGGAALAGILQPLWSHVFGTELAQRYIADGAWVTFGLYGTALLAVTPARGSDRLFVVLLALFVVTPLAAYHRFGAVCMVLGLVGAYAVTRRAPKETTVVHPILVLPAMLLIVGVATTLMHQHNYRKSLPVSDFAQRAGASIGDTKGAMLLAAPDNILLQATTGVPVLVEATTPSLISYVPGIGPSIDALYRDIYGYGFTIPKEDAAEPQPWDALWQERSETEWRALASTYGFTHVVAPAAWNLNLPRLFAEEDYALYAIVE
ncbi:MAG: hypothetical protein L3K26_03695 [Candidatus Hydrogenedentes bacterium]|nr:hypothetical protein [Candidatus Hydrogenedentota bacterium]